MHGFYAVISTTENGFKMNRKKRPKITLPRFQFFDYLAGIETLKQKLVRHDGKLT